MLQSKMFGMFLETQCSSSILFF